MIDVPAAPLKIVFFFHLVLTTWATQGYWLPNSYIYYNAFFLLTVLWAIHQKDSEEPVLMAMTLDVASILIEIIVVSVYGPSGGDSHKKFTMAMAIINIILRPISSLILYRVMNERVTGVASDFGIPGLSNVLSGTPGPVPAANRGPYEDIDRPQSIPQNNYEPFNARSKGPYANDANSAIPD